MAAKAIFLDRDDTIIEDPGYINDPEQVKLLPGVSKGLSDFRKMGYKLIVVTNQSGVARGMFTEEVLAKIHERLKYLLAKENVYVDRIYYCPYHKDGAVKKYRKDSDMRKPKPGMLLAAAEELGIDLKKSWMIGNSYHDVEAGKSAGCKTILVKSYTSNIQKSLDDPDPDYEAVNLVESVNIVKRALSGEAVKAKPKPIIEKPSVQCPDKVIATEEIQDVEEKLPEPGQVSKAQQLRDVEEELVKEANRTEQLLEEIKHILKSRNRQDLYDEFSGIKLTAGVLQIVVVACIVVAVLYKMSPADRSVAAFTSIGFAIVFQLMALTLYMMNNDR